MPERVEQEHPEADLLVGVTLETGKEYVLTEKPGKGKLSFKLMGQNGLEPVKDKDIKLKGKDLDASGRTDAEGAYEHAEEVLLGEYTLVIGSAELPIQAIVEGEPPHVLQVPSAAIDTPQKPPESPPDDEPAEEPAEESSDRPVNIKGSVGSRGKNDSSDVQAVKQKLKDLGFEWLEVNGTADKPLEDAISLFQSIKSGRRGIRGDGRVDVDGDTHQWLEASNAPKWKQLAASGPGFEKHDPSQEQQQGGASGPASSGPASSGPSGSSSSGPASSGPASSGSGSSASGPASSGPGASGPSQPAPSEHGTSWLEDALKAAGQKYEDTWRASHDKAAKIQWRYAAAEKGGDANGTQDQATGLALTLRLPTKEGKHGTRVGASTYDRDAVRAMLQAFRAQPTVTAIYLDDAELAGRGLCTARTGFAEKMQVHVAPPKREA